MVWSLILLCCIALINSVDVQAATYSCYDGNISSTYLDIFDSISVKPTDDYVVFRGSQYDYYLVVGNLELNNNLISGSGTVYNISNNIDSNYTTYYIFEQFDDNDISINIGNHLVYSSLGSYPSMYEESYYYQLLTLFVLIVFFICIFLRSIFSYTYRNRKEVDL